MRITTDVCLKTAQKDRYIVNVSSMEGKFTRNKNACHPHTNMVGSISDHTFATRYDYDI